MVWMSLDWKVGLTSLYPWLQNPIGGDDLFVTNPKILQRGTQSESG